MQGQAAHPRGLRLLAGLHADDARRDAPRDISHRLNDAIHCNAAGLSLRHSAQHGLASLRANACCRERFPIWCAERVGNGVS
jgi:hypothetical protein